MPVIALNRKDRRCTDGFFVDYRAFTENQESPEDFHIWVAISMIASALSRNVWLDRGHYQLFPNLYVVLIAESANLHKSTAIRMGMKLLREVGQEKLNIFSQKTTPESLIKILSEIYENTKMSIGIIEASEFSVFLGNTKKDQSLIQLLTDLYDCPTYWDYTTIGRGKNVCNNVCINLLGGSTTEWMKSSLPEESMGGGFFSRLIPVYRIESGRKIAHPEDVIYTANGLAKENLLHDLQQIMNMQGPFTWTPKAKIMFSDWYMDYNKPENAPPQLKGYYGRKGDMIIKLSMICSASHENSRMITERDFEFAMTLLNENENYMLKLTSVMGQTEEGDKIEKVLYQIRRAGHLDLSSLQRKVSHQMNALTLKACLDTLVQSGQVLRNHDGKRLWLTYAADDRK